MNLEGRPSLCRKCGAIVGAGQTSCAVCGAELTASAPRDNKPVRSYDRDAKRFARAVLNRSYLFTILFLVANFFVFLLMWQSSGMQGSALWAFPEPVLQAYGAKINFLIKQNHEWWRLVTPIFIHVNLLHLLVNMYSLWMIGPYVERLYGSAKFVFFWVVTGVAGCAASYLTMRPPSAGASGALFGLIGVLFVFGIKYRRELPEGFKRAFGTGLLPVILINLFIGFIGRGFIDNAAHLGGLASGAALGLVVDYKRPGERATLTLTWRTLQILSLALVAVSFFMVARHFNGQVAALNANPSGEAQIKDQAAVAAYLNALNEGQRAFHNAAIGKLDPAEFDQALEDLNQATGPDDTADHLGLEMKALLERVRNLVTPQEKSRRREDGLTQTKQLYQDFQNWVERRDQWIKDKGDKYGIELVAPDESDTSTKSATPENPPAAAPGTKRKP
jgi:membrane associated rhomboid family serine protease